MRERTMRERSRGPESAGGGGTLWPLAVGLAGVILVALALLVGSLVADALAALATWAVR
jgi:hypothetical protein